VDRDKLGDNVNRKQEIEFKEERKQEDRRVPSLCGLVRPLHGFKFITIQISDIPGVMKATAGYVP